jgi:hypothetical protein
MTLAANGAMSVGGNTFTRSINLELGRAFNTQGALGSAAFRTLAGVPSGAIRLGADFYSKFNVSLASITSGEPFEGNALAPGEPCEVSLNFASNGTWEASLEANGTATGNWATTADAGSTYHIRFTRTFFSGGFGNSATASTGWLPLNVSQGIQVFNSGNDSSVTADYTIEIATDSGGTNILDSASFITLNALLFGI